MAHFASMVERYSDKELSSRSERASLAEVMLPEMQKALDDLRMKTGVYAFRIHMDEFEPDEGYECDFQVKWALTEDWESFNGDVKPKFSKSLEAIYEVADAMDMLAPMLQKKVKLTSEPKLNA